MKNIKKWFYKPIFTLLCYLLAIVLLGYALFTIKNSYEYIAALVAQGSVSWSSDIKDIISYFVGNSANYLFYTFSFVFFGKVINLLSPKPVKENIEIINNEIDETEDEINDIEDEMEEEVEDIAEA